MQPSAPLKVCELYSHNGMTLTTSQGLHSLSRLGVDHRDVSIGNILLSTDPDKVAGFISDLDLSSIREEAIKAAYPNDYDTIIKQMKSGEWRTVCDYHLDGTRMFSHTLCAQGTALFMARSLLNALDTMKLNTDGPNASDFTFQHRLCHDLELLILVIVYAMMIHHRNNLAPADKEKRERYKGVLDRCWAAHAYSNILMAHDHMMASGCFADPQVPLWFPDPLEAALFREAMRLIRNQGDGDYITYKHLCTLFKKHIDLAKEPEAFEVVSK